MKIDNIDNISNKEKSPDKAERSASIEELKKTQKFFDYNDLSNAATINDGQQHLSLQEKDTNIFDYLTPPGNANVSVVGSGGGGSSKLKKLLLNSDPEVANFSSVVQEKVHNNSEYLNNNNNNNNHDTSSSSSINNLSSSVNSINNCNNSSSIINKTSNSSSILAKSSSSKAELNAASTTTSTLSSISQQQQSNKKENAEKKNVNTKKLFNCNQCKEFIPKLNLFDHMKNLHNKFTCLYCYGFFVKIDALERHLTRKHKVQNTPFVDAESLANYFNVERDDANVELEKQPPSTRMINAVCCKCGTRAAITNGNFPTNCCSVKLPSSKQKNQVKNRHPIESDAVGSAVQNDLNLNCHDNDKSIASSSVKLIDTTKADVNYETSSHQWQQSNTKTTFNGASSAISNETSSQNVPPPNIENNDMASWHIEEQKLTNCTDDTEKLVVPKLTLKIPKAFQNQKYNAIDSEEDSGDEEDDEDDDEEEEEQDEEEGSASEEESSKQNLSNSNINIYSSSSLSDSENEEEETSNKREDTSIQKRPENMPSLKLTIKNLTSTPIVLEARPSLMNSSNAVEAATSENTANQTDVDMTECPMDLEPTINNELDLSHNSTLVEAEEEEPEKEPEPKKFFVDGVQITPAHEDIVPHELCLDEGLDKMLILKLMKICLRISFPYCLYCNHARKIVVNGKGLATHFITHHRFHAFVDSITAEELHPEKFNTKFEQCMDELQLCFFNLDTFDDHDEEKKEGHVTISHDKLYECFQCRFQTPIHKELYLHNRKMHQKLLINCLMCKMSFHSYSELLCHICPGVPNKQVFNDFKFYCCLCNMDNIPSAFRLMVHLRKKHYACDVCLEKCSDQSKLSSHVWKHKLLHICYRCHIFYQNKADIMKHLFWKHGTEGVECKKCLQKKWPHVYHFCIPPANFTCQHCEMQFSRAMALKVHLRLHEDGAKYACTEIGCEKKFISKKLLIRHLERHQSELAAQQKGEGEHERTEGTVIIPAEIPDGFCTRTIPVVFKRFIKKPAVRKIENDSKSANKSKGQPAEPSVVEKKEEKDKKSLLDLPETKLNLSESSDSDSSASDNEVNEKAKIASSANDIKPQITPAVINEQSDSPQPKELVSESIKAETSLDQLKKVSTLSDSDDDDENAIESKDEKPSKEIEKEDDSMKNIMENLKNYQDSQLEDIKDDILKVEAGEEKKTNEIDKKMEDAEEVEDKLPEKVVLHVCRSDHDYAKLFRPAAGTTEDDLEDMIKSATINKDKNKKSDTTKDEKSKTAQGKKKAGKNDDFSSSDSSSGGSSSDSSSGSSSGSSSSSSSGSSSDSSSSEASSSTKAAKTKPRNKKFTKKRSKKDKKAEVETEEEEPPRDPDDIIYESDLQTDETDTDEDFYDEHPLKMNNQALTEKRKQLGSIDGIIENSRPSTPSLPPDEKLEKRLKIKKRKREHKKSSPTKRMHLDSNVIVNPDDDSMSYHNNRMAETPQKIVINFKQSNLGSHGLMHTSTPIAPAPPRIELHQANQIRQLLQSTQQQPILPILLEQQQQQHTQQPSTSAHYQNQMFSNSIMNDYINVSHVSSAQSSRMNSDNEQSGIKRSQRRRIPNKFYGYTSDDDSMAALVQNPNDPFKPIPPPLLTWDKEDLPSRSKSPTPGQQQPQPTTQAQTQQPLRVNPLKLIINGEHQQQQQHQENYENSQYAKQLPVNNLSMKNEASVSFNHHLQQPQRYESDSGSSDDDDQLHISEPGKKRKRKPPSQSMYTFHTLETPPSVQVDQPPIPRLKLTIGSNNKIRRRNINPLKPPAKKRKVAPKSSNNSTLNSSALNMNSSSFLNFSTKPSFGGSLSQAPSTSSKLNTSETAKTTTVEGRAEKLVLAKDKKQKLEEAILNTQQYFQRYNHAQVTSDIPQDAADNDGRVYCYCRRPYDDLQGMIGCDGPECEIEWFHFECVGILVPPKGNWFCPQCQKDQATTG